MFYKDERLALFIDGSNLYAAAKSLGFDIDYKLLRQEFMRRGKLLRAFYYTALLENDEYSPIRPLVDWLNYNGFTMVTKPAKEYTDSMGRRKVKGNMDIELAVDAMELAPRVDHIVLFSGDGDFRPLIESLQRQGVRVSVVATIRSQPGKRFNRVAKSLTILLVPAVRASSNASKSKYLGPFSGAGTHSNGDSTPASKALAGSRRQLSSDKCSCNTLPVSRLAYSGIRVAIIAAMLRTKRHVATVSGVSHWQQ